MEIAKIKSSDYQAFMNLYGQKVVLNTLQRINSDIKKCIDMAKADKILIDDFTLGAELYSKKPNQGTEEKYLHSEKDYLQVLKSTEEKFNYSLSVVPYIIYFLFKTGMRYGELVAITWDDIDYQKKKIHTYRRFNTAIHDFVNAKNSTSIRDVPLDEKSIFILKEIQHYQKFYNKQIEYINSNNLVFQHYGYKYSLPDIVSVNKAIKKILTDNDIQPMITTKGARHTYGSYLWHKGIDLGVIAKILGHKDITMLIEVYGHTLEEKIESQYQDVRDMLKIHNGTNHI